MLKNLSESDFAVLRRPFESGRQAPGPLGGAIFLFLFIQPLFLYFEYDLGAYSVYPYTDEIILGHFAITGILMVLSIVFSASKVYLRFQKNAVLVNHSGMLKRWTRFFVLLILSFVVMGMSLMTSRLIHRTIGIE